LILHVLHWRRGTGAGPARTQLLLGAVILNTKSLPDKHRSGRPGRTYRASGLLHFEQNGPGSGTPGDNRLGSLVSDMTNLAMRALKCQIAQGFQFSYRDKLSSLRPRKQFVAAMCPTYR
jgi:hypothetical protein